MIKIIKD